MGFFSDLFNRLKNGFSDANQGSTAQLMDPNNILFSLPTFCDRLPDVDGAAKAPAGAFQIHEDDWRQVEFVDANRIQELKQKLSEYTLFRDEHRKGSGFTKVYVREDSFQPLAASTLKLTDLGERHVPLAISGHSVRGGFAVNDSNGFCLYAQSVTGDHIDYMGISPAHGTPMSNEFLSYLASLVAGRHLILVDWYTGSLMEEISETTLREWASLYASS